MAGEGEGVKKIQSLEKLDLDFEETCSLKGNVEGIWIVFTFVDELVEETEKKILEHEELDLERKGQTLNVILIDCILCMLYLTQVLKITIHWKFLSINITAALLANQ